MGGGYAGRCARPPRAPVTGGSPSAAAIPDFSGIWSHPSFPGFEPPASGPGPVVNKVRRPQVNFDGRVLPPGNNVLVSNPALVVGDYSNPILKPNAAAIVKQHGELELSGAGSPTPTIQCWPEPVPYIFNGVAMQMLQQPDKIIFLYPNDHQVRYVRMNGAHPAQVTPSWYGNSVGHYEGDTLVIDTVGVKIGPFAMVDFYGTPYTSACTSWNGTGSSITKPQRKAGPRRQGKPAPRERRRCGLGTRLQLSWQAFAIAVHGRG